jgi:hypothetical protein
MKVHGRVPDKKNSDKVCMDLVVKESLWPVNQKGGRTDSSATTHDAAPERRRIGLTLDVLPRWQSPSINFEWRLYVNSNALVFVLVIYNLRDTKR